MKQRIPLLLTVALVMVAMMVASAMPAFAEANPNADPHGVLSSEYTCYQGTQSAGFAVFYNGLAYIGNGNPDQPSEDVLDMLFHKAALCIDTDLPPAGVCKLVLHRLT